MVTHLALRAHAEAALEDEGGHGGHGIVVKRDEAELGAPIANGGHELEVLEARGWFNHVY